ncbi:MAG: hypothetical protein CGU28_00400 [Candidatus Dactylopiibacterium carminicum]|uniref:DUF3106 domain-containing protein n=1 Tax=Candidatus Dactylopiibacterium carminicum TaxID=857335 RepID=A0A272EYZ7_9RHOO|nr:DUF3106 domain-containing protein [Candidatus Dactylopiibacterium carminicum]KAF7600843.1 DUF3106 domain-containing protein [Candidatus Dactylopiibacterium carminicum]PAS95342.1 MAG: hypothetical protein CGU29_00410 [Candidatus Dactylopiibacterium carminicum]PAS98646.1 MAG: hypothetical protein CGU28_00400 [Candidatus Dactylopiibacterium carminicum]PAT00848.1 MAG: hypothetical protein BSR46_00375 [Candidatus Dactylopiibacterium carminicum]
MAGRVLTVLILCFLAAHAAAQARTGASGHQPDWSELNAQQRTALAPLSKEWNNLSADRRQRWLGIARRYPKMNDVAQARIQDRMREWVMLSPLQRDMAREQFLQLQQRLELPADLDLNAKWQEYSALPAEERSRLRGKLPRIAALRAINPAAGQRPRLPGQTVPVDSQSRFGLPVLPLP